MNELETLLHPISPAHFTEEYFEKKPLYIPAKNEKFGELFDQDAFWAAISNDKYITDGHLKAAGIDSSDEQLETQVTSLEQAKKSFQQGKTLCAQYIDFANDRLADYLAKIGHHFLIASPNQITFNAYFSADGKGFQTHLDTMSVWIMQIEGKKKWRYASEPILPNPKSNISISLDGRLVGKAPEHVVLPDESKFSESTLNPGDVLYLPPGTWHRAEAIGSSLGLTLTLPEQPPHFYTLHSLAPFLEQHDLWTRDLPAIVCSNERGVSAIPDKIKVELKERLKVLKQVINELDEENLYRLWCKWSTNQPYLKKESNNEGIKIQPQDVLFVTEKGAINYFVGSGANNEKVIYIYYCNQEATLPYFALSWIKTLLRKKQFVAESATSWNEESFPWPEISEALQTFMKMGILEYGDKSNTGTPSQNALSDIPCVSKY